VAVYAAVLYVLALERNGKVWRAVDDSLLHAAGYGLLGLLALRGFHGGWSPLRARAASKAFVLTVGYGIFTELSQFLVPYRDASPWDVAWDAAGFLLALLAWAVLLPPGRGDGRPRPGGL
jgi:VanZ family protein